MFAPAQDFDQVAPASTLFDEGSDPFASIDPTLKNQPESEPIGDGPAGLFGENPSAPATADVPPMFKPPTQ